MKEFEFFVPPNLVDTCGIVIGIVGFLIAVLRIRKITNAASAATEALDAARAELFTNQIRLRVPQFKVLETDLMYAADSENRDLAHRTLLRLSELCSETARMLEKASLGSEDFLSALRITAENSTATKIRITTKKSLKISLAISSAQKDVSDLSASLAELNIDLGTEVSA